LPLRHRHCHRYDERLDLFTLYYRLVELNRFTSTGASEDGADCAVLPGTGGSGDAGSALAAVVETMRRVVDQES
jgi:hypothetical protein